MVSFLSAIFILILGYFVLSRVSERIFGIDPNRKTPAITLADGIDFVALPLWKIFLNRSDGYEIRLNRNDRSSFLDSLMIYCQFHLSGFYTPNSLAVVRQIFE